MTVREALAAAGIDINTLRASNGTGGLSADQEGPLDDILLKAIPDYYTADQSTDRKLEIARQFADNPVTDTAAVSVPWKASGVGARTDEEMAAAPGVAMRRSGLPSGTQTPGGWFAQNAPEEHAAGVSQGASAGGGETAPGGPSFGSYGSFTQQYTTPERPASVSGAFTAPTWNENYQAPTQADLEASPGYLASETAMQRGMERSAAAKGTVLSGGFVGRTLPRAMGEHAAGAYQQLRANSFDEYLQRYGQFQGGVNNSLAARGVNEGAYQTDVANAGTQSNTRYGRFMDAAAVKRQSENDLWGRNMDLTDASLRAAALARPY